jgi:hypothetical protein
LAAARVRLPTSLAGVGLRSMVTINEAGYFASVRAVAPFIAKSSSPAARAAIKSLTPATEHDATAAPMLRAVAAAARVAASAVDAADKHLVALDTFCDAAPAAIQRKLTHTAEAAAHADAVAAVRPDNILRAFLLSCDGRWVRVPRLNWLQLSNEETVLRMQRYLRQPLSALAGAVGTRGLDKHRSVIDKFGDALLSGYKAKGDGEYIALHNALCRVLSTCASQARISNTLEGGKVQGTKKRPGDVRLRGDSGSHGWAPAGKRELWSDITCVCPVLPSYVQGAAAARGSAAGVAAHKKRNKYRSGIPGFAFFLPLAFETEGYHADDLSKLLLGFAEKRAMADGYQDSELKARKRLWTDYWLNHFAVVHARYLARCVVHRAAACKDAGNPPYTRASFVDVLAALDTPPPPPRAPPCTSPPSLPGTASEAAHAPAH